VIDTNIIKMFETSVTVNGSEIKSSKEINYKNRPECIQGKNSDSEPLTMDDPHALSLLEAI
jgi:hypothetical protein